MILDTLYSKNISQRNLETIFYKNELDSEREKAGYEIINWFCLYENTNNTNGPDKIVNYIALKYKKDNKIFIEFKGKYNKSVIIDELKLEDMFEKIPESFGWSTKYKACGKINNEIHEGLENFHKG